MALAFQSNLVYAVAPAAVGLALAAVVLLRARADLAVPVVGEAVGRVILLFALPTSAVVLAFAGALASDGAVDAARTPLLALGGAALVQALAQGVVGARGMRSLVDSAEAVGRVVATAAAFEVPTLVAFVWLFVTTGGAAAA